MQVGRRLLASVAPIFDQLGGSQHLKPIMSGLAVGVTARPAVGSLRPTAVRRPTLCSAAQVKRPTIITFVRNATFRRAAQSRESTRGAPRMSLALETPYTDRRSTAAVCT